LVNSHKRIIDCMTIMDIFPSYMFTSFLSSDFMNLLRAHLPCIFVLQRFPTNAANAFESAEYNLYFAIDSDADKSGATLTVDHCAVGLK